MEEDLGRSLRVKLVRLGEWRIQRVYLCWGRDESIRYGVTCRVTERDVQTGRRDRDKFVLPS